MPWEWVLITDEDLRASSYWKQLSRHSNCKVSFFVYVIPLIDARPFIYNALNVNKM